MSNDEKEILARKYKILQGLSKNEAEVADQLCEIAGVMFCEAVDLTVAPERRSTVIAAAVALLAEGCNYAREVAEAKRVTERRSP